MNIYTYCFAPMLNDDAKDCFSNYAINITAAPSLKPYEYSWMFG